MGCRSKRGAVSRLGKGMGKVGCIFDEIGNLVESTERRYRDVLAGPQRS